ncbi:MAG TPA: hypothetical protein VHD69_01540 [Candidatus Paceibacterota bacterium]|nr:hypothetical protein [Candidatus Paceibacterota bacterium]
MNPLIYLTEPLFVWFAILAASAFGLSYAWTACKRWNDRIFFESYIGFDLRAENRIGSDEKDRLEYFEARLEDKYALLMHRTQRIIAKDPHRGCESDVDALHEHVSAGLACYKETGQIDSSLFAELGIYLLLLRTKEGWECYRDWRYFIRAQRFLDAMEIRVTADP